MALRRINREIANFPNDRTPGISWSPEADDLFRVRASITGPADSPYAGGIFFLKIELPTNYPFKPPKVMFTTRIYHPNIDINGSIYIDILRDGWSPRLSINSVLVSIWSILGSPVVDESQRWKPSPRPEILHVYVTDRARFERIAREYTRKYAI